MKSERVRLQKYIANCGYCSRRKAELLIDHGLVHVNGEPVKDQGWKVTPGTDRVTIHGEEIARKKTLTIMLNKSAGFITSTHDTHQRPTVLDLLPRSIVEAGVLPAGRLDLETEGLILLTNDGELLHRVSHKRYGGEKEYRALLNRTPSPTEVRQLERGVFLEEVGRETQSARVTLVETQPNGKCIAHIVLREGMKRQVRLMFATVDIKVLHLERIAIGKLRLGDLERGKWRELTETEIAGLVGRVDDRASRRDRIEPPLVAPRPRGAPRAGTRPTFNPRGGERRTRTPDARDRRSGAPSRTPAERPSMPRPSSQRSPNPRTSSPRPASAGSPSRPAPPARPRPTTSNRPARPQRDDRPRTR
ncbi:MAG: pseudouridine synthase [Planctomycetota bacterium]